MAKKPGKGRIAIGIDGRRGGWVGVVLQGGSFREAASAATVAELLDEFPKPAAAGIDIPIGLPARDYREADLEARAKLGARQSTIFLTPPDAAMRHESYEQANAKARKLSGKGISKQAYALREKVLEVEQFLADSKLEVVEVHPEVCFARMNGWDPLLGKRTWGGIAKRIELLGERGVELPPELSDEVASLPPDDVLDAAAVAWSADRHARGKSKSLPRNPPQHNGRAVAIWY